MPATIPLYNESQDSEYVEICRLLAFELDQGLPEAESKIWHAHPVWFLNGNPVAGYSRLKNGIRLLFWSGQSFDEPALSPEGRLKAAEIRYQNGTQVEVDTLRRWLSKARSIQWDYKNLVKRRGILEPICGISS